MQKKRFKHEVIPLVIVITGVFLILPGICFAEIGFSGMDLSESDFLLFKMSADFPGFGVYDTLFVSNLSNGKIRQLTFFPESVLYLSETGQVQIQNRFGVFRTDFNAESLAPVDFVSSFLNSKIIERGRIIEMSASPDGRYILFAKNTRGASADLVLSDLGAGKETVMITGCEIGFDEPPVLWSDDSRFVVYTKAGALYYFSLDQLAENRVLAEQMRKIGNGNLANVNKAGSNAFYYVQGHLVYRILTQDFFTLAFYREIFNIGTVLGRIPYEFDQNFDRFWIPEGGGKLLLDKGGRNLLLCYLKSDDFGLAGNMYTLPYLCMPSSTRIKKVIWPKNNIVTILTHSLDKGSWKSSVFRLSVPEKEGTTTGFLEIKEEQISDMMLAPSGNTVVLIKKDKIDLKNYTTWSYEDIIFHPAPISIAFKNTTSIVIGGGFSTIEYDTVTKKESFIALSQVTENGFTDDGNNIQLRSRDKSYQMSVEGGPWKPIVQIALRKPSLASQRFRVYAAAPPSDDFSNMIMVRNLGDESYGTFPLINTTGATAFEAMPKTEEAYDLVNFNHGSRVRKREVAVVFDVVDSVSGLSDVLKTLSEYGLKCTFFINGEAIRRYPGAVYEIASSGHECASLFFAYFNMTDSKYSLDKDFIKKGLKDTESAFHKATGKELSLFWHAPYFFVNSKIIEVSREMGYVYIGRDVNTLDWVTLTSTDIAGGVYMPSANLVDKIIKEKKPGSIIPVNVGVPQGKREDYLYAKLSLLINTLKNRGYEIVPVSVLYSHAK